MLRSDIDNLERDYTNGNIDAFLAALKAAGPLDAAHAIGHMIDDIHESGADVRFRVGTLLRLLEKAASR